MRNLKRLVKKWLARGSETPTARAVRRPQTPWIGLEGLENRVLMSASIGSLGGTPNPVTIGAAVTLTATNVTDSTGTVTKVEFVRDVNGNGIIDKGDQVLGLGKKVTGTNNWQLTAKTGTFTVGTDKIIAVALDSKGTTSPVASTTVTVNDVPPVIQKVNVSGKAVANGNPFTLTAPGVTDHFAKVTSIAYYFDANGTGVPDPAHLLGTATSAGGFKFVVTDPSGLPTSGNARFLAVATNANGTKSTVAMVSIKAVAPPIIGSFSGSPNPVSREHQETLTVAGVTAATGATIKSVAIYLDANGNGVVDKHDTLLGHAKLEGGNWVLSGKPGSKTPLGALKLLAIATDSNGFVSAVATTTVTVTA